MKAKNQPHAPRPETPAPAASAEPTVKMVEISEAELAKLREQATQAPEHWDKFLRAAADLENYRKRVAREKEELSRYAAEQVVAALLPVLDNLERALGAAMADGSVSAPLAEGLQQIQAQFRRALEGFGLEEVRAHAGQPFDPHVHEAVGHLESTEHPEGTIMNQVQRGFTLAQRLLRPARVVVSKGAPEKLSAAEGGSGKQPDAPSES